MLKISNNYNYVTGRAANGRIFELIFLYSYHETDTSYSARDL